MADLTVGQVAGLINTGVALAQLSFPLIVAIVLVGVLNNVHNAVTWSVVGRMLNGSFWPSILQTDTAATKHVNRRVLFLSILSTFSLVLLGVSSAVTPLGLQDRVVQLSVRPVPFTYMRDESPMGQGTNLRTDYRPNRRCGEMMPMVCSGAGRGYKLIRNTTRWLGWPEEGNGSFMSSDFAANITEIFTSATNRSGNTIAGFFDMEYRAYIQTRELPQKLPGENQTRDPMYDRGEPRTAARFSSYQSLALNNRTDVVEGLVVDTRSGGVGFRNHTAPRSPGPAGMAWEEDLLWLEPETVCVNSNLTVEFSLPFRGSFDRDSALLTDRGGFVNLTRDYPYIDLNHTQAQPQLYGRAWKAASINNMNLMRYFGQSRNATRLGKQYSLADGLGHPQVDPNRVKLAPLKDRGPGIPGISFDLSPDFSFSGNGTIDYFNASIVTRGFGTGDRANITNIVVEIGMLLGAPSRVGGSGPIRFDPGTNWSAPLFACATAVRASIKTVSFQIGGEPALSQLSVTNVKPKSYSNNASKPLWGVEDTGLFIRDVSPTWGIVDDRYEGAPALWTVRSEHLYLPAGSGFRKIASWDANAGGDAAQAMLYATYASATESSSTGGFPHPQYSGETSYPLFSKWQDLSRQASSAHQIINIIWTDFMANYVVGTRGQVPSSSSAITEDRRTEGVQIPVNVFTRRVRYDLRYAIPALIFLVIYILVLAASILLLVWGRAGLGMLRRLLNLTAVGRAVTIERAVPPKTLPPNAPTKEWIQMMGNEDLGIRKYGTGAVGKQTSPSPPLSSILTEEGEQAVEAKPDTRLMVAEVQPAT
ncbi:MAG: hypothetical protein M1823_005164 [Watsoniomyces obsoletus]|nr:MAG: hypothetical protein M1823_005164 [Watsoniomyces obsoletus]